MNKNISLSDIIKADNSIKSLINFSDKLLFCSTQIDLDENIIDTVTSLKDETKLWKYFMDF